MNLQSFSASLRAPTPPPGLSRALDALWYEANGEWDRAHRLAQSEDNEEGAWMHAYLHRVEGNSANAAYWYRRAQRPIAEAAARAEWAAIVQALLAKPTGEG